MQWTPLKRNNKQNKNFTKNKITIQFNQNMNS